jgi:hypothetical protein
MIALIRFVLAILAAMIAARFHPQLTRHGRFVG